MSADYTKEELAKTFQECAKTDKQNTVTFFMKNIMKNKGKTGAELVARIFNGAFIEEYALIPYMLKGLDDINNPVFGVYHCAAVAVSNNTITVIDMLHECGYDFNSPPPENFMPLIYIAIDVNLDSMAAKLISYGLKPDMSPKYKGQTPLTFACHKKANAEIFKLLLDAGADPNQYVGGDTALRLAIRNKSLEVVKLLSTVTKYVSGSPNDDYMQVAIRSDNIDIVREIFVMSGSVVLTRHMSQAWNENRLHIIEFFLQSGFDANSIIKNGCTMIHSVCADGSIALLQLLLKYGARTDIKTDAGMLPIFVAMCHDRQDVVEFLESQTQ